MAIYPSAQSFLVVVVVPVTGVSTDQEAQSFMLGETLQLTATVEPHQASHPSVIWSSADTGVAYGPR